MRPIKFRAWNDNLKKMIFLDPHQWPLIALKSNDTWFVMQFTGLLDRTGKEIYEGDVLEGSNGIKAIVEWTQEFGRWSMRWSDKSTTPIAWHVKHAIVIGNIHENPKLLIGG